MSRSSFHSRALTSALSAVMVIGIVLGQSATVAAANAHKGQKPDVSTAVGPFVMTKNLKTLPYLPVNPESDAVRLTNHPKRLAGAVQEEDEDSAQYPDFSGQGPIGHGNATPPLDMPDPVTTFAGMTSALSGCGCLPPDTQGDVGPNAYIQSVNSSIRIHDKVGVVLAGPITYNSFFSPMGTSTPCGNNQNQGDGQAMYDHISDRWVITDFAFPAFPGTSFYQCIGVSRTADPVAGGWYLYAVQVDPGNTSFLGDYPKMALWPDAYYLSVNMFSNDTTFNGVRVFALDRAAMVNGGSASTIAFTILPANLGDQYSLLPATFRTGDAPPAGQDEWFANVNSSASPGTVENKVFIRRFHADFVTPANSYFGVGSTHAPDSVITVANFVDAFTTSGADIVPNGTITGAWLDTLGDKLMFPLVYQRLNGVESLYASHTVNNNQNGTGPTAIRWYQFDVTNNTIATTPVQQQTFNNGNDGLWRWMPSINVDRQGDVAVGYTASSTTVDPGIRYAGRLAGDSLNTLAQGEAVLAAGAGHQTSTSGRWGDYSVTFVDPSDGCTFYHTNEYYSATSIAAWSTRVGLFRMPGCVLVSISVTPANPSIDVTSSQQFTATGTFDNGATQDITNSVSWSSSNTGVATTSNVSGSSGLATPVATGQTTIRATDATTAIYGETTLTVTKSITSIAVTPANPSILTGESQQFTATATYSDASTQDLTSSIGWSSSNTVVATVTSSGLATGLAEGSTTIAATDAGSGVYGTTLITVSNTPPSPVDTTAPVVSNVTTILREGGHIGSVSVTVSWSASDNVTPTNSLVFEIQRRRLRAHGWTAWQDVATVTGQTSLYQVPLWHRYQYRVRGRDQAGNWSDYAEAYPVTFIRRDERSFTRDATWTITHVTGAMRGSVARSSTPGGTASLTFTGSGVAVVATTGPGQGTLQACLDPGTASQSCRTIDLSALPAGKRQLPVVFTVPWATHTLRITVIAGTVDLDGAIFSR